MTTAQIFQESIKTSIFGMGLVLGTLFILSVILDLMRIIFAPKTNLKKNEVVTTNQTIKQTQITDTDTEDDTQLIAVITAAISQHMGKPITHIKINSIQKIHKKTPIWGITTRIYNINNKL
ncbi:MAG: OadG family protein [Eubacteriales bacterium]|nr:OadG family protein [Eubacteriales bacterium]